MPEETDWEVYKREPSRTPVEENVEKFSLFNLPIHAYRILVDRPITLWKEWMDRQQEKHRYYYYHRSFRRVPDLTECLEDDYECMYEAEMQWKRDLAVDREILNIMRERYDTCVMEEGGNHIENCAGEFENLKAVSKAYWSRYGDLGGYGNARKCLMKQKHQMIDERKAQEKTEKKEAAVKQEAPAEQEAPDIC